MQPELMMDSNDENKTPDIPYCQPQMPVLAELLCTEVSDYDLIESGARSLEHCDENTAESYSDLALLHHPEVMSRLKLLESQIETPKGYFFSKDDEIKNEVTPYMRKFVGDWMMEVCEARQCNEAVFPLAMSIFDRFLSDCLIKKEHLQLVACVCILLASKSREINHFPVDLLCFYSDYSLIPDSLRTWELAILSHLNWEVSMITPMDFVDLLLVRSVCDPYKPNKYPGDKIRSHAVTYIALCSRDPKFVGLKPSLVAAAAIFAAVCGNSINGDDPGLALVLSELATVSEDKLRFISNSINQLFNAELKVAEQQGMEGPLAKEMCIIASSTPIKEKSYGYSTISESGQMSGEIIV